MRNKQSEKPKPPSLPDEGQGKARSCRVGSGPRCEHGQVVSDQGGIVAGEIAEWEAAGHDPAGLLEFYSACDCCDTLMHKSTVGHGYFVMRDGRTLCGMCAESEPPEAFDGAAPRDTAPDTPNPPQRSESRTTGVLGQTETEAIDE